MVTPWRAIRSSASAMAGRGGRSLQNAPPNDKMLPEKSGRGFGMKLNLGKWLVVAAAMAVSSWAPARADVVVQIDRHPFPEHDLNRYSSLLSLLAAGLDAGADHGKGLPPL